MLSDAQLEAIDAIEERPEATDRVEPEPEEVSMPARRLALTRALVVGAIRRYDETLAARRAVWDVAPRGPRRYPMPGSSFTPEEVEILERAEVERDAWKLLCDEAESDFSSAERALAERIQALYDALAAEHDPERGPRSPHGGELAVKVGETTYVLASDSNDYEPETNMIAIIKDANIIDLDGMTRTHNVYSCTVL